jgi:hypothetical protein
VTSFLTMLDGMVEATEEFIGDDGLRADDGRIHDLSALLRVRDLYTEVFQETDEPDPAPPFTILYVDAGMWADPAVLGPYETADAARSALLTYAPEMEQEHPDDATRFVYGDDVALILEASPR